MLFKLDKYISDKLIKYEFFNALLHDEKRRTKVLITDILLSLDISDSSYRRELSTKKASGFTITRLLKHFNYNYVDASKQETYEFCLQKIYYNSYFRLVDKLNDYLEMLDLYIVDNNYLKPIFYLFKVFGYIHSSYPIDMLKVRLSTELDYLLLFKDTEYFKDEFELLYLSILYYFKLEKDSNKIARLVSRYSEISWLYNNIKGSFEYTQQHFDVALYYYNKVHRICLEANNMDRANATVVNIACCHNNLEQYDLSLDFLKNVQGYMYTDKYSTWITFLIQHYIHALFMIEEYESILKIYQSKLFDIKKLSSPAAVECILASDILNKKDEAQNIIEMFTDDHNVKIICEFLSSKDKQILNGLEDLIPFEQLIDKLVKMKRY